MAGVSTEQDSSNLNVELNLVPFIDLLSTLVLFLLVTAVWLQISVLPAAVEGGGKGSVTTSKSEPTQLRLRLTKRGIETQWPDARAARKLHLGGLIRSSKDKGFDYDALGPNIEAARQKMTVSTASVSAEDTVDYGEIVRAIDVLKALGLPVALSTE